MTVTESLGQRCQDLLTFEDQLVHLKIRELPSIFHRIKELQDVAKGSSMDIETFSSELGVGMAIERIQSTLEEAYEIIQKCQRVKWFRNRKLNKRLHSVSEDIQLSTNRLTLAVLSCLAKSGSANIEVAEAINQDDSATSAAALCLQGDKAFFGHGTSQSYEKAYELYLQAARQGYGPAYVAIASMYHHGTGKEKKLDTAIEWYEKAGENSDAYNSLGYLFEEKAKKDEDGSEHLSKSTSFFRLAADMGNLDAVTNIGYCYENGRGVEQNYKEAAKWYSIGAKHGYSKALNNLGQLYFSGRGLSIDYKKAVDLFYQSSDQGNAAAQNNLGVCYEEGKGVDQDFAMAGKFYRLASDQGHPSAMANVGYIHMMQQNYATANPLFRKAADAGCVDGLYYLGLAYESGLGVERHPAQAFEYFKEAATKGHTKSQIKSAAIFYSELRDFEKAFEFYNLAAQKGEPEALNSLGVLFEEGHGVERDVVKAREYYQAAAAKKHPAGLYNLGLMYESDTILGEPNHEETAMRLFKEAAELGSTEAQLKIIDHHLENK